MDVIFLDSKDRPFFRLFTSCEYPWPPPHSLSQCWFYHFQNRQDMLLPWRFLLSAADFPFPACDRIGRGRKKFQLHKKNHWNNVILPFPVKQTSLAVFLTGYFIFLDGTVHRQCRGRLFYTKICTNFKEVFEVGYFSQRSLPISTMMPRSFILPKDPYQFQSFVMSKIFGDIFC